MTAYWAGHYVVDIIIHLIIEGAALIYIKLFSINIPDVWVIFILFSFAHPAFLYLWQHMFEKEGPAGTSIRLLQMFIGALLPIVALVLQFFKNI